MYFHIRNTQSNHDYKEFAHGLARWTSHQIEHSASAFGFLRVPKEAYAPKVAYRLGAKRLTRGSIARLYINIILNKAMEETQDFLFKKIKKEGVFSLYQLLEGQPLLKSMTEFLAANDVEEQAGKV